MAGQRGCVGIVREVYSRWEHRTPLCPRHVQSLVSQGLRVIVQPSPRRVFSEKEFADAGAEISDDLQSCNLILGVKQVQADSLLKGKSYMFFSHVIKGQSENMPLLDRLLKEKIRLFDYECIRDNSGIRKVAFGRFAGNAGMIDSIRGFGEKLLFDGVLTPFVRMGSAYMYPSLSDAKNAVTKLGQQVATDGVSSEVGPVTFVFTGSGNASLGAQEIFKLLPHEYVSPEELPDVAQNGKLDRVYGCVATAKDMVKRKDGAPFHTQEYYTHQDMFEPIFHEQIIPYTSVLMNCMYWDQRFPRLLTNKQLLNLWQQGHRKLKFLGEVTCDVRGSVECFYRTSTIENPFFSWDIERQVVREGLNQQNSLGILGVEILPSELPQEASGHFGDVLLPYIEPLTKHDGNQAFENIKDLPSELLGACITYNGALTDDYAYLDRVRKFAGNNNDINDGTHPDGKARLIVSGHLFDTSLLNQILDAMESDKVDFQITKTLVGPNRSQRKKNLSTVVLDIDAGTAEKAKATVEKFQSLTSLLPHAKAEIAVSQELPWVQDMRPT
eukprot:m.19786 g.19786  ORF g.19786 m.19786 type:complete len:554 (-) comp6674_c0_seq1:1029-2690(-)